jgi:oxygen-independent coproporphyrinogen-3 oxidase
MVGFFEGPARTWLGRRHGATEGSPGHAPAVTAPAARDVEARSLRHHYPPVSRWSRGFDLASWLQALDTLAAHPAQGVALEVHLPFCASRCPYCDVDVTATHDDAAIDAYLEALGREMDLVTARIGRGRDVLQLHVGGGTPNHLRDDQLCRLLDAVRQRFGLLPDTEASIECDPRRCSATQLETLRRLGFGHLRLGMADLQPDVQQAVGRLQSRAMLWDVVAIARRLRFESVQIDLLCGLPQQTRASLDATLDGLLAIGPDRIRCLRYEHRPERHAEQCTLDREALPGPSARQSLWRHATQVLRVAGYEWIGCDLFVLDDDPLAVARDRGELRCNGLGFAPLAAEHLLAFGCGRISDVAGTLVRSEPSPARWQARLAAGEPPWVGGHRRSEAECQRHRAMQRLATQLELPCDIGLDAEYRDLAAMTSRGWVDRRADRLRVTPEGRHELALLCALLGGQPVSMTAPEA